MTTITLFHGTNSKYNTAGIHDGASWTSDIRVAMEYAKSQRSELGGVVRVLATVVEWDDIADIELCSGADFLYETEFTVEPIEPISRPR